jgi:DNA-directed RNA polymerase subunit RPC12/RpoP
MQRDQDLWNSDEDDCPPKTHEKDFTCDECGRTFQKPILATISTSGQTHTYYACPRCMTKVPSFKEPVREKEEKGTVLTKEPRKPTQEPQDVKCGHFFGYLNKHQKNMPFPDECLTCSKMVECLRH